MHKSNFPSYYSDAKELATRFYADSEQEWLKRGQKMAFDLFHDMAKRVPAYKEFLKYNDFSVSSVKTFDDFRNIPAVDKDNYLRKYPHEMLCWDGKFSNSQWVISTTSGSSGIPYYFPREKSQELQYAISAEQYLVNNFHIDKKTTLYIIGFPMGAWIGGVFTYEALKLVNESGNYNMSIITAGIDKTEIINAIKQFHSDFDQIIIGSYAPFLKDILDDGVRAGINWKELDVGFVFSAEAFSEKFRDYVKQVVSPEDELRFSLNHYGTVDQGTLAHETPESILVRRLLVEKGKLGVLLPEESRQPTLCQYNPEMFYFEQVGNGLYCSSYSGIPLVRYDLKDYGGVIERGRVKTKLQEQGINMDAILKKHSIDKISWNLPYLYVYERNDMSVSYYSFIIYPEMIRKVLQDEQFDHSLTGKFSMFVEYDDGGRHRLYINAEMKFKVDQNDLELSLREAVHESLLKNSSEYRETSKMISEDEVKPVISLWDYEHPKYFKPGGKQKWVIK